MQTFGKATEKDPEAIANLRRTEELFRKALENAGLDYAVQTAAQTIDENGKARYNDGEVKKSAKIVKYIPYSKVDKTTSLPSEGSYQSCMRALKVVLLTV